MIKEKPFVIDPLRSTDASDLTALMTSNAARFTRFFSRTLSQNMNLRDSKAYILLKNSEAQIRKEFTWAIRSVEDDKIKGLIILREIDWDAGQGELSYCIGQANEGQGWITQAVSDISAFIFSELDLKTLRLIIHESNTGSIRVAEKSGYAWKETLPKHYTPPNESALNMELYELKN